MTPRSHAPTSLSKAAWCTVRTETPPAGTLMELWVSLFFAVGLDQVAFKGPFPTPMILCCYDCRSPSQWGLSVSPNRCALMLSECS